MAVIQKVRKYLPVMLLLSVLPLLTTNFFWSHSSRRNNSSMGRFQNKLINFMEFRDKTPNSEEKYRKLDYEEGEEKSTAKVEVDTFEPDETGVCHGSRWTRDLPTLYMITPTYLRAEQIPELTRLGQTLLHGDSLVWIVAEDASKPTQRVIEYLKSSGLCYVYLKAPMPSKYRKRNKRIHMPRGVSNRMAALDWIRKNAKHGGVMYFADDDNTYSIKLFNELRKTKKISMFPVGLATSLGVSSPMIRDGKVVGFYDGWMKGRRFPVDMAGFGVNVDYFISVPTAGMPYRAGREETGYLESLNFTMADIEPLANNCENIYVWHTQTKMNAKAKNPPRSMNHTDSNVQALRRQLWR